MKVFITGIEGFTGKYLEQFLISYGYDVYGSVLHQSSKASHFQCDIRIKSDVKKIICDIEPDFVFHLAAISFVAEENSALIYDVNVIGTQNVLDALLICKKKPQKIIIASSATVYGGQGSGVLRESMCPAPVNHYAYSKLAVEHLAKTYFNKLNIIVTRPFNYTGYGHAEHFVVPKIVKHFVTRKSKIELGNINVAREFNSIDFLIDIYYQLMKSDAKSIVVNVCSGKAVKLKKIIEHMINISKHDIEVLINQDFVRKNEIAVVKGSVTELKGIVKLPNETTLFSMLENMYARYKND